MSSSPPIISPTTEATTTTPSSSAPPSPTTPTPAHVNKKSVKDYKIIQRIGGGAEGSVLLATDLETQEKVALKCIICRTEEDASNTKRELNFLMDLRHGNIVHHKTYFEEVKKTFMGFENRFYLVMELCPDGSLEQVISEKRLASSASSTSTATATAEKSEKENSTSSENNNENQKQEQEQQNGNNPIVGFDSETILGWTHQICECMTYLHSNNIIHRDIKSENILLTEGLSRVKVCDFGFVRRFEHVMTGTVLGTMVYMAPEIFQKKRYDEAVDIWSLGVVVLQLLLLKCQNEVPDVRLDIQKNPNYIRELLGEGAHPKIVSIIEGCLRIDPGDRPTASEIMELIDDENVTQFKVKKHRVTTTASTPTHDGTESIDGTSSNVGSPSSTSDTMDPMWIIKSKKAAAFWADSGWSNMMQVDWMDFKDKYQQYIGYQRTFKVEERGFKKLLCDLSQEDNREIVTCQKFNDCTIRAGFPFDRKLLHRIEMYTEISDGSDQPRNYDEPMSLDEFETAREQYLSMIVNHDRIFVDPISQETLDVDQHCAPLRLVTDEEWSQLIASEFDMDKEDDKLLRLERLGQFNDNEKHENAINYLVDIRKAHRYIVLGAAAAGKTCMMRLLMYKAALKAKNDRSGLIPIFIPITNLASFQNLEFRLRCIRASADSMMNQSLRYPDLIEHFLITVIRNQRALLLFDGMDEAATLADKRAVEHGICRMRAGANGIIITSRVSGFETDEEGRSLFEDYTLARIQPLSFHVQKQIAEKRGITDETFNNLLKGKYQELAKTPLLLSLMIQEYKSNKNLPEVRSDLYNHAITTMFEIYFRKTNQNLSIKEAERTKEELRIFLKKLACQLHHERRRDFKHEEVKGEESFVKTWNDLKPHIDAGKFSLVIVLNGNYRFSHLSFQEYFVASTWANSKQESEIRHYEKVFLRGNVLNFNGEKIKQLLIDPWYRETFLLCAGAMEADDFSKFATFLLKLYRKQGGLIDAIVYNMISERPESEKDKYKDIEKSLNSERKVKILVEGLTHDSEDLREMALGRMSLYRKNTRIIKDLLKHLVGDDEQKRKYAATALSLTVTGGDIETRDVLLERINDTNSHIRELVVYVLGNIADTGDEVVIPALLQCVNDSDETVAKTAMESVCKVGSQGDETIIAKMIEKLKDPRTRATASNGLGVICDKGNKAAITALTEVCTSCEEAALALSRVCNKGDVAIRNTLLNCLKQIKLDDVKLLEALDNVSDKTKSYEVIDLLLEEMKSPKRRVAYRMAYAFGSVCPRGDALAISKLVDCMEDKGLKDKAAAALGLIADVGNEAAIDSLIVCLRDRTSHFIVREQAAIALSKVAKRGDQKVIAALCERLGDTEEVINASAAALETITDKDNKSVLNAFLQLMKHPDSGVVERAIQSIGRIASRGDSTIKEALLNKLNNKTAPETVRSLCAQSLGLVDELDNEAVIQVLVGYAQEDESSYVRRYCLDAIGCLISHRENTRVTSSVFELLKHEEADKAVREHAVANLAKICDIQAMIELLKARSHKAMRPVIFDIIVKAIRIMRDENPNWKLEQSHIDILSKFKSLESTFVMLENAG